MKRVLVGVAVLALLGLHPSAEGQRFTEWSTPVNLGPVVNSSTADAGASLSRDGLSLYFGSSRSGTYGLLDIYVSHRASIDEPWGPPVNLGPTINTAGNDQTPFISVDGHHLYFASDGRAGVGSLDIYVARRQDKRDDLGWQVPVNLGTGVNTVDWEYAPVLFEDEETGTVTLFISCYPDKSSRDRVGSFDIYASTLLSDKTFGPATLVEELSTTSADQRLTIRKDGLELLLDSGRGGAPGSPAHLWVFTRASTAEPWSNPFPLASVNSIASDLRPALSFDGTELYFHSNRAGGYGANDLYRSTRTKITGRDK